MTKNLKAIKTTIMGFLVWIATGFYAVTPYFSEKELWEVHQYEVWAGVFVGALLLIAPDRLVDWAFKWLDKKK